MHFTNIALATVATVGPIVSAHGSGLPKIMGLHTTDLKARNLLHSISARMSEGGHTHVPKIQARDSPPECGEGIGSCPAGKCCSRANFCGTGDDYCYSPGCNYQYGPGCPENNPPAGSNTSSVSREKLGKVAYGGEGIFQCTKYTAHILDLLKSYNAKATFFMTGNNINKGQIDIKHADTIKRVHNEGHQVASHTFTHLDLSKISSADRKNQMWMNEMAIRNVLGFIPVYMRPPYSSCTSESGCQQDMADLGYHITNFNVDTDDYNQNTANNIQKSKDAFTRIVTEDGASAEKGDKWLAIGHDILDQTANNLTEYMLQTIQQLGYKAVTVGDCLGDPKENWYRTAGGAGNATSNSTSSNASDANASTNTNGQPASGSGAKSSGTTESTGSASTIGSSSAVAAVVALFSIASAFIL
ncbi:hypothetical protein DE146DRAFT_602168 [Phaeosphaeria sp. MPI-PUGE-AT-0046c]|nr:hypothetical protein DE146DRAFT_602168 [Phaeosphaeria sp. MPI-PUGE-AT-0046c]